MIYLDSHVLLWLIKQKNEIFPRKVRHLLDTEDLYISPIVLLELQYLYEVKRTQLIPNEVISQLQAQLGLNVCDNPFIQVIQSAASIDWTRDPFDRIITAQASITHSALITKDQHIQTHYPKAVWD